MLLAGMVGAAFAAAYVSAAVGIAGGTLFIVLLYLMLPPQAALPLHGAVQVVNNEARSWVSKPRGVADRPRFYAAGAPGDGAGLVSARPARYGLAQGLARGLRPLRRDPTAGERGGPSAEG